MKLTKKRTAAASLFIGPGLLLGAAAEQASATVYEYEIVGDIDAPLTSGAGNRLPQHFRMDIDRGDLILSYDDQGTTATGDDRVAIKGRTSGCIGGCSQSMNGKASQPWGLHEGSGNFDWDLKLTNVLSAKTEGPEKFAFGMEMNVGTLTLADTTSAFKDQLGKPGDPSADVTVKTDGTDYGFRIFSTGKEYLEGEGWLAIMGGFLGLAGVRFELGPNNNFVNWDFKLYRKGEHPEEPPSGEVPEPASCMLLAAGLASLRKKLKNGNS